jgi:hypothetical protein
MKFFGINIFNNKVHELIKQKESLEKLRDEILSINEESKKILGDLEEREEALINLKNEQSKGNPYLAKVISEYFHYRDYEIVKLLENKKRPAKQTSLIVKKIADENKDLIFKNTILENYLKIYENLFPFIKKVQPIDLDFLLNNFQNGNIVRDKVEQLMQLSEKVDIDKINQNMDVNIEKINQHKKEAEDKMNLYFNTQNEHLELKREDTKKKIETYTKENKENLKKVESEILENIYNLRKNIQDDIKQIMDEQSKGNPNLARLISDYYYQKDLQIAFELQTKIRPATKKAEEIRKVGNEKKQIIYENIILKNYIKLYESLFPFILELQPVDLEFLLNEKLEQNETEHSYDINKQLVPEYNKIENEIERNQKALDRYIKKHKSNIEIGKMYERYIGFKYEQKGYDVEYFGIEKGFDDLGRDLICRKDGETLIVQCKNWSLHKEIKEAHINQLFGTTVKHYLSLYNHLNTELENTLFHNIIFTDNLGVKAIFVTSTKLSNVAKSFAKALKIEVYENELMDFNYPMIKCNLEKKIYHLPFDQQYDNMIMGNKNRKYVQTIKEAEDLGCRRAYRWNPNKKGQ